MKLLSITKSQTKHRMLTTVAIVIFLIVQTTTTSEAYFSMPMLYTSSSMTFNSFLFHDSDVRREALLVSFRPRSSLLLPYPLTSISQAGVCLSLPHTYYIIQLTMQHLLPQKSAENFQHGKCDECSWSQKSSRKKWLWYVYLMLHCFNEKISNE